MAVDVPDWMRLEQLAAPASLGSITVAGGQSQITVAVPFSTFATGLVVLPVFLLANPPANIVVQGATSGMEYINGTQPPGFGAMPALFAANIEPIDTMLEITVTLSHNAAGGGQLAAYVFELFGAGIEQVANNALQPLFVTETPWPSSVTNPFALATKSFVAAPAAGASTTVIAGIAGTTITVYSYDFTMRPTAAAVVGAYRGAFQDTGGIVAVARADIVVATVVGITSVVHTLSIPKGIPLPGDAGLEWTSDAAGVAACAAIGVVSYTQF